MMIFGSRLVGGILRWLSIWYRLVQIRMGIWGGKGDPVLDAAMENLSSLPDGNYRVVKFLLDHGANPDAISRDNETIIQLASRTTKKKEIIDLLIRYSKVPTNATLSSPN